MSSQVINSFTLLMTSSVIGISVNLKWITFLLVEILESRILHVSSSQVPARSLELCMVPSKLLEKGPQVLCIRTKDDYFLKPES